ncbi:MAG TPA: hypothetical protein VKT80_06620, partial [Chloroflexota bacterium]|nr:hypothetical protein [Chloroflexota bacterium]
SPMIHGIASGDAGQLLEQQIGDVDAAEGEPVPAILPRGLAQLAAIATGIVSPDDICMLFQVIP